MKIMIIMKEVLKTLLLKMLKMSKRSPRREKTLRVFTNDRNRSDFRIVSGDVDKFAINPSTGVIRTTVPLDFERRRRHSLVVGTEESRLAGAGPGLNLTATVEVKVTDVNDVAPKFFQTPRANTIQVRNDVAPGQVIGLVRARDGDGSPEHSRVRYGLSESRSSDYASKYFAIDEETGG